MRRATHLPSIVLVCFGLHPLAINAQDSLSEIEVCMYDNQGGQMGIRNCYAAELSRLEAAMDAIIEKKRENQKIEKKKMEDNHNEGVMLPKLSLLDDAQEKWLAFRDAQCAWEVEKSSGGTARRSMYALGVMSCQFRMTRDRILKLKPGCGVCTDDESRESHFQESQ